MTTRFARYLLISSWPLLAAVGPLLAWGASHYWMQREDQQRARNLARVEGLPDAVLDARAHDFGVMLPRRKGSHVFVIHNRGGGPLELAWGGGSDADVRGELSRNLVPPGQTAEVRVAWRTGLDQAEYRAEALVTTNDPSHRAIWLAVHGRVQIPLETQPARWSLPRVEPGQAASVSALVYSRVWSELPSLQATCSLEGATCHLAPASADMLTPVQGRAGALLTVTLPAEMPSGPFDSVVRLSAPGTDPVAGESLDLEIPLSGRVLRRLAVYGEGVDSSGVVDLGIHRLGNAYQRRLVLKVRDDDARLSLVRAEFRPDFLQAALRPAGTDGKEHLYQLELTIPADAPECIHRGASPAAMTLYFSHPRITELSLALSFAVLRRR